MKSFRDNYYISMLESEIAGFYISKKRREALDAKRYYRGEHDILKRSRTAVGGDGEIIRLDKLPCTRIVNNQYGRLVDQKIDYSLGRPFTVDTDNGRFRGALTAYFGREGLRLWRRAACDAINCGVAWLHPYIDEAGELKLTIFDPVLCHPLWADAAHTRLDALIRLCPSERYDGHKRELFDRVYVYTEKDIQSYELVSGKLYPIAVTPYHFTDSEGRPFIWGRVPVIPVKYNSDEIPMIRRAKSIQDALNELQSVFCDNMAENSRNTVLVLRNFDGQDLGEFRRNLAEYGAVKVRSDSGGDGGVDTLSIEVNASNYEALKGQLSEALIECCRGFDTYDGRLGNNPNRMNVLAMYSNIDLDANGFEAELSCAFDEWIGYIRTYLFHTGKGDFRHERAEIKMKRDLLINESSIVDEIAASADILSRKTLIENHPLVENAADELIKLGINK